MRFLTPEFRKKLYAFLAAAGVLVTVLGIANQNIVTGALGLADAVLALVGLVVASWKAQRWDFTAIYAGAAAVVVALKVLGVLDDGASSHVLDVLAAAVGALPLLVALVRTDPATPTGEPRTEFAHA